MITAIDSNILYDILGNDPDFYLSSQNSLQQQHEMGSLIISPIVFAELLVYFLKKHGVEKAVTALKEFLQDMSITIFPFSEKDYVLAAEAWGTFTGKRGVECPHCGTANQFFCSKCGRKVNWRNHLVTDFLIGAHAQNNADGLLTRDRGYYRKYFKAKII